MHDTPSLCAPQSMTWRHLSHVCLAAAAVLGAPAVSGAAAALPTEVDFPEDDEVCAVGDEACALSLRQLRSARLSTDEADLEAAAAMAAAMQRRATQEPGVNESSVPLLETLAGKASTGGRRPIQQPHHYTGGHQSSTAPPKRVVPSTTSTRRPEVPSTPSTGAPVVQSSTSTGTPVVPSSGGAAVLYHQTSPEIEQSIMSGGFRAGHGGWCGGAIYFATSPKDTFKKAISPASHLGVILQADVNLGNTCHLGRHCDQSMTAAKASAMGCDSIRFNPGDGDELVIWDPSRVTSVKQVWNSSKTRAATVTDELTMAAVMPDDLEAQLKMLDDGR